MLDDHILSTRRHAGPLLAIVLLLVISGVLLGACGESQEPRRVELPVVIDSSGTIPVATDLGYEVELTEARVALADLLFLTAGEAHTASLWERAWRLVVPVAYAHPGHYQTGDVTGELRGRFIVSWLAGGSASGPQPTDRPELGLATLLEGTYQSANFTFVTGTDPDGLASDDPLLGHTAILRGVAVKDGATVTFTALIDSPEGRELVGAPCEVDITGESALTLGLRFNTRDPLEGDTLFDGIDFVALDEDGDGVIVIDEASTDAVIVDAYNLLRRTFQTHDHFEVLPTQDGA